ncbi:MAG: hypothetical protein ACJAUQ_002007, partial [Maribacter sp.]
YECMLCKTWCFYLAKIRRRWGFRVCELKREG